MLPFDDAGNLRALDGPPDEVEAADSDLRALVGDELAAMARRLGDVPVAVGHPHLVAIGTAWGEGRDELARSDATVKCVHRAKLARRSAGLVAAGVLATLGLATGLAATELLPKPAAQVAAAVSEALGIPVPHSVQVAAGRLPAASDDDLPPGRSVNPGADDADEFATGAPAAGRPANPVPTTVPATTVPATTGTTVGPRLSVNRPGAVEDSATTTSVAPADPCAAPATTAPPPDDTAPPPPPTAGGDPTAPADDVAAEPASTANAAPAQTGPAPDTGEGDPDTPPAPAPYQNPPTTLDPAPPTTAPSVTTPPTTPATGPPTGECGSSGPGAVEPGPGTSAPDTTDGAPPPADPTAAGSP